MEILDKILEFIAQYQLIIIAILGPILEFALRKVESKKPLSLVDKVLDVLGYGLFVFGFGPAERLVKKLRELLNKLIPERLKAE